MTSAPTPPNTADSNRQAPANETGKPAPFYRRSFFWVIIGMLLGLLLVVLMYSCQPAPRPTVETVKPNELLDLQRAYNKGLEDEVRRLQEALKKDPCSLPEFLGTAPDKAVPAPSYGTPAPQTTPQAPATPVAPGSNATAKNPVPAPSAAPAPSTVSELMDRATVFILAVNDEGAAMGSGFFVAPGIIATNRHVVQRPGSKILVGNKALGGMQPAELVAISNEQSRDYALLRISNASAAKVPVLQVANGASRTDRISAWGFPGFITEADPKLEALLNGDAKAVPEVVYSEGVVSVVLEKTPPMILHTAPISQGNSGGPLINAQGVVVGINTFIRTADKSYSQTSIALPGEDLARFMKEHGVTATAPAPAPAK